MEEKVFYQSTDDVVLCGLLSKAANDDRIVVMCHGIRGNKEECGSFARLAEFLSDRGINAFRFDFRGHCESSGAYEGVTISKEIEDLEQTLQMLKKTGYKQFVLIGASFGAGIVCQMEHKKFSGIDGVICWYGALDYEELKSEGLFSMNNWCIAREKGAYPSISISSGEIYPFGEELFEEVYHLQPMEKLEEIRVPVCFVHGDADSLISCETSKRAVRRCRDGRLVLIADGEHSFDGQEQPLEDAIDATAAFVEELWSEKRSK